MPLHTCWSTTSAFSSRSIASQASKVKNGSWARSILIRIASNSPSKNAFKSPPTRSIDGAHSRERAILYCRAVSYADVNQDGATDVSGWSTNDWSSSRCVGSSQIQRSSCRARATSSEDGKNDAVDGISGSPSFLVCTGEGVPTIVRERTRVDVQAGERGARRIANIPRIPRASIDEDMVDGKSSNDKGQWEGDTLLLTPSQRTRQYQDELSKTGSAVSSGGQSQQQGQQQKPSIHHVIMK